MAVALRSPLAIPAGSRWVLGITFAYVAAFALSLGPIVQLPLALLFFLTCPGMLLADWLDIPDTPTRLALSAAGSLAVNILAVTTLLSVGLYSTMSGLVVVALASAVPAVASFVIGGNRVRVPSDQRTVFLGSDPEAWPTIGVRSRPSSLLIPAGDAGYAEAGEIPEALTDTEDWWQVDSTAWGLADGSQVMVLSVVDEASRVCVSSTVGHRANGWLAVLHGAKTWTLPTGVRFREGAIPEGAEWHWGMELLGIAVDSSAPTLAKRFHKTLKKALRDLEPAIDSNELQRQIDDFVRAYNFERPHQAVGGLTPAERFAGLNPAGAEPLEVTTHTVNRRGRIEIPGPHTLVVPARHADRPATTVRNGAIALVFVDGAPVGHVTITPGRKLHRVVPFPEAPT